MQPKMFATVDGEERPGRFRVAAAADGNSSNSKHGSGSLPNRARRPGL